MVLLDAEHGNRTPHLVLVVRNPAAPPRDGTMNHGRSPAIYHMDGEPLFSPLCCGQHGHHDDNWQLATLDDNPNPRQEPPGPGFFLF